MDTIYGIAQRLQNRIEHLASITLKPSEFCKTYINDLSPDEWGYRAACINLLSGILKTSKRTIEGWQEGNTFDNCPHWVSEVLSREHTIRQIKKIVE